ncbi:MAG TPA: styrene monooxygenase/indole monooxygenase family protein [Kofleriaceae bacterium]|nr:styrene monooxygenase/indole monooxygenase family protein [Kofleriaceae bacterium]
MSKRKITIVGAGQAGLQLGIGLVQAGYEVTCVSNRTPEEIRGGRVMSSQCLFETALVHERALGINFWDRTCPPVEGIGLSVPHPEIRGAKVIEFAARLEHPAQSVDQRVKFPRWMEHFAARGGELRFQDVALADLEAYASSSELVVVASGKGDIAQLFPRDASRSPYDRPMRALALVYVTGMAPRPEYSAVNFNLCPGVGEYFPVPAETITGPCDIMVLEGIPGGPMDCWEDVATPDAYLARAQQILETFFPWEAERCRALELTDPNGILAGRFAPTVRAPIGVLPSGRRVLGLADAVVLNDPITGQGAGNAAKAAAAYLASILERGDAPFDAAWMQATFDRAWGDDVGDVTAWSNALLSPPPQHVLELFGAACSNAKIAHRFVNGFEQPSDFKRWFMTPEGAQAYLREVAAGGA